MAPTQLRHPVHASELIDLLVRRYEGVDISGDHARSIDGRIHDFLVDPETTAAVFAERDRKANLPIPTPAGDLVPGTWVDIKTSSGYGSSRTIKGARVSPNNGLTEFDPKSLNEVRLERRGQSLRVKQREIVEIVVQAAGQPVHGG